MFAQVDLIGLRGQDYSPVFLVQMSRSPPHKSLEGGEFLLVNHLIESCIWHWSLIA